MNRAHISLGSNIEPAHNLREAVRHLSQRSRLRAVSPVYESLPVGTADQPNFLNAAALIETHLSAPELKAQVLEAIEHDLGRVRTQDKNGPRTVDLDIALFGNQVLRVGSRHIPDPDILKHAHVALPLADLSPRQRHPKTGQTLQEIARSLPADELRLRSDISLWSGGNGQPTTGKTQGATEANRVLEIDPADYDVFRNDLLDMPVQPCMDDIECAVQNILTAVGEDISREGLQRTPARVSRMYEELTAGYRVDPVRLINDAIFDIDYDQMVLVKDIDFYSLCEHHMLPFLGQAHVAYIPNGKVIGLSKIPRIVEMFARRLQVQERMTQEIAEFLDGRLNPLGVAVVCEGLHMCSAMRGVKKANARMTTSAMLGAFKTNQATRSEFFQHIGRDSLTF